MSHPVLAHPYVLLARRGDVVARFAATFLSAVPIGMLTLTTVLAVRGWTGSYAAAGLVAGAFGLGDATGLTMQGRLLPRFGARRIVGLAGTLCVLVLAGFGFAGRAGAPVAVLALLAALGGATMPCITASVRGWLPAHVDSKGARTAAYSLLSVLFQGALAVGPLLVGAVVLQAPAEVALLGAMALVAAATVLFVGASRADAPVAVAASHSAGGLGRRFWALVPVAVLAFSCFGVLDVALPALQPGAPASAALMFTAFAVGQGAGALAFGARAWPGGRWLLLAGALVAAAAAFALIAVVGAQTSVLVPLFLVVGAVFAPVTIVPNTLLDELLAAPAIGRGYATLIATGVLASSGGAAIAGMLVGPFGARALLLLPAAALLAALAWTVTVIRALTHHPLRAV